MPHWMSVAFDYLWNAVSTHPFNFFYLAIIGLFSLFAFIVSLHSLKVNRVQAEASRKQAEEATLSRRLNEQALKAQADAIGAQAEEGKQMGALAERSAKASEESAQTARAALEITERPWIIVSSIIVERRDGGTGMPESVTTIARNSGRTPALRLEVAQWSAVTDTFWSPDYDILKAEEVSSGPLGPNDTMTVHNIFTYAPDSLKDLQDGKINDADYGRFKFIDMKNVEVSKLFVFLYGRARYEDPFGKKHETYWALQYNTASNQFGYLPLNNSAT